LLPNLTTRALKASSRPNAILILPSTVCFSRLTTRNSNFQQQLAKGKKVNPNQWEVHLIEFIFYEDTRPDPQFQKAKAQHSVLISNLHRQGYGEVKLHNPRWNNGEYLQMPYRQTFGRPKSVLLCLMLQTLLLRMCCSSHMSLCIMLFASLIFGILSVTDIQQHEVHVPKTRR